MTALLVASTGGHLSQLARLRSRIDALGDQPVVWVTFDKPQSRSLLRGEDVIHVPYTGPRDVNNVAGNAVRARGILRDVDPELVISTGSAISLSFLPLAAARGAEVHYIESAARSDGPSLSGRLLSRSGKIRLYTQHRIWAREPWFYRGSVFDTWQPAPTVTSPSVGRMVVTLGTIDYSFRRLVEQLIAIIPPGVEVLWQTGATDVAGLGIEARATVPNGELDAAIAEADVVVGHSGIGSAIATLEAGRCPVLVPRERRFGEHVDDHQQQIAGELSARGLAVTSTVADLRWDHLVEAASLRAVSGDAPAFELRQSQASSGSRDVTRPRPRTNVAVD
jgi:UDP-N-acetylglucosamine--N-acetylmuramyl-(pentapeptide) pyrophosphoryl-undecaprenol N-acetylglucosamine transferase